MVFCNFCRCETDVEIDDAKGISCCVQCGRVLEDIAFSADVTFQKDAAGESTVVGQFVNESGVARGIGRIHGGRVYAYQADSHERAQQRGRQDISHLVDHLSVRPREETIESAHRLYKLALQRGFTRGRRTNQVAAACLYLVCRQDKKPFLLIDFSDALQVNVFTVGAVFLQLAKLLRLEDHPLFSKPVDPSLYIHRFADRMKFPNRQELDLVSNTAMRLVASMKRDWIQTGRRPSGVCGAALYIAAHLHGHTRTKKDVVAVVHIGEHTLAKRLNEFSTTDAGSLTKCQFEQRYNTLQALEQEALNAESPDEAPTKMIAACEHINHGESHFKNGMCKNCYVEFVKDIGGTFDGANPPAFSRNRIVEARKSELLALPAPNKRDGEEHGHDDAGDEQAALAMLEGPARAAKSPRAVPKSPRAVRASKRNRGIGVSGRTTKGDEEEEEPENGNLIADKCRKFDTTVVETVSEAAIKAAEEQVSSFDQAIAKAEAAEEGKKRRRTMSTAAVVAMATAMAVQQAAVSAGADTEDVDAVAGAIVPAGNGIGSSLPVVAAADFALTAPVPEGGGGDPGVEGEDTGTEIETLSDISDSEIDMYLADEEEVKCKEELWDMMNQDWVEKQEAKKAALEAAERAQEEQRAAMEAAEAAGVQYKRGRGRPLGSKTKPKPEMSLPPAETPQEAAMRMLDHKKLSSKINYNVLADLFSEDGAEAGEGGDHHKNVPPQADVPDVPSEPRAPAPGIQTGYRRVPTSPSSPSGKGGAHDLKTGGFVATGGGAGGAIGPRPRNNSRISGMVPRVERPMTGAHRLGGLKEGFGPPRSSSAGLRPGNGSGSNPKNAPSGAHKMVRGGEGKGSPSVWGAGSQGSGGGTPAGKKVQFRPGTKE